MTPLIKSIIFDFGGVIFNISHEKVEKAYRELGMDNFDRLFNQATQAELFQRFEKGEITPAVFRSGLRKMSGLKVDDPTLDRTWNEILCDYPRHRLEMLRKIRANYRLFLLSNTNTIHYDHYISQYRELYGHDFNDLFDDTFWSFKIGKRKPDPDPYLHILDKHGLDPGETLFVDDSIQNIRAAEKLGILALYLNDDTDVTDFFEDGILKPSAIGKRI